MLDYCQCGPGHPANGIRCYICELPAKPAREEELWRLLDKGGPFAICLSCGNQAEPDDKCTCGLEVPGGI